MNLNIERKENLSSITIPGVDDLTIEVGVTEFNYAFLRVNSHHRALYGNGTWSIKSAPKEPNGEGWTVTEVKVEQPSWALAATAYRCRVGCSCRLGKGELNATSPGVGITQHLLERAGE
jgi:hypothetical protein